MFFFPFFFISCIILIILTLYNLHNTIFSCCHASQALFYSTFRRICIGDIFRVAHLVSTHFSWRLALSNGKYLSLVICLFLAPFVPQSSCFIEKVKHAKMTYQQLVSLPQLYLNLLSPLCPLISFITESEGSKQIQGETQLFKADLFVSFAICMKCLHS